MRSILCCALVALVAMAASGQQVVVGGIAPDQSSVFLGLGPQTFVDLSRPANRDGTLTTAALNWGTVPTPASCANGVKLKFLRRNTTTFTLVAERGPFPVQSGYFTVTLTPPVAVQEGDLLGVVQMQNFATCGGIGFAQVSGRETLLRYTGIDLAAGNFAQGAFIHNGTSMMARASSDPSVVAAVIPVVGSTAGGSTFFRTAIQAFSASGSIITGKFVFHPAGRSALPTDPSMDYTYGTSASPIPDLVAAMGQTGLGSIDIVPTTGVPPRVIVRIFSDGGAAGTAGFTTEPFPPDQALSYSDQAHLIAPSDLTNYRMNVGIRTLGEGATINIIGQGLSISRTYGPNFFEQVTLAQFLGGATPVVNGVYNVRVDVGGRAFIYSTTTDNRTNDTAIRFLTPPQ
jgi:hypothetical protein